MITFLKNDKDSAFFTFLNNGDIRESFNSVDKYIEYLYIHH